MPEARVPFDDAVDWLAERDIDAAQRLRVGVEAWTEKVARHLLGTPHAWHGCKATLYKDGYRRIIYRHFDDRIEIVAFRDARQDNSAFDFIPPRIR